MSTKVVNKRNITYSDSKLLHTRTRTYSDSKLLNNISNKLYDTPNMQRPFSEIRSNSTESDQEEIYIYGCNCKCVPKPSSPWIGTMIYEGVQCTCVRNNSCITKEVWSPFSRREYTQRYQRRQLQSVPIQLRPLPPLPPLPPPTSPTRPQQPVDRHINQTSNNGRPY